MNNIQNIVKLYFKSVKRFNELESKPKDFGTGDLLYSSEIHTLMAIGKNPNSNLTELASIMDITKGGAAKFVKKLIAKELIIKKSLPNNRKEVFFELTDKGRTAFRGHEDFSKNFFGDIYKRLSEMSTDELEFLEVFLDDLNEIISRG